MSREVMQQALDAFDSMVGRKPERVEQVITALREELAKPEPIASEADTEELIRIGELPEPLRLAAMLEKTMQWPLHGKAADCLRRMYAEQRQLKERTAGCTLCGHCAATGERITTQHKPLNLEEIAQALGPVRGEFVASAGTIRRLVKAIEAAHDIKEKT